jgi:hypothetical protein
MAFTLDAVARLRPFLYHLTDWQNVPRIRRMRMLESATALATAAGRADVIAARRRGHVQLALEEEAVLLRDQAPLHVGNMRLDDGWTFEGFVRHLNDRVFFWPGTAAGPIDYGVRHYERYAAEHPALLRVPFRALLAANPTAEPQFCRYNSGSPRWSRGVAAPRGSATFVTAAVAQFSAAQVVEVTVPGSIVLPVDTMIGGQPTGPWEPLFPPD